MNKSILERATQLNNEIVKIDFFLKDCEESWKRIFIPKQKRSKNLRIGCRGYGYINQREMDCGKELSEIIFDAIEKYRDSKQKEFESLNSNDGSVTP